ncbi:MAG TPA: glycoside hydrolase family 9 protein, partial [Bacteroidales bacterium]|nr:glycoside hydrolase family 9 protein [Bacteroidales bacterium]
SANDISSFSVCDAITDRVVFTGKAVSYSGVYWGMKSAARLDFSSFNTTGGYYIIQGKTRSESFRIAADVYDGTADYILKYIRAQRCGYNPFLLDSCHTHDGIIVDHPTMTGQVIDVVGGWHDASDHLRYSSTSANSVYQMLFAWNKSPEIYRDDYDAAGLPGSNDLPDILDEAKWGLEWLLKMNPDSGVMYNQVADDRDHRGFRLPNKDKVSYGLGPYRPVYFVTGKPQGLAKYKNRTEGVASTAGKFSSAFALGARTFALYDPLFADQLASRAGDAFEFGLTDPGATQTACTVSPYFYEEDNYVDDLQLAAWELFALTGDSLFLVQADYWGTLEPLTPWIEQDTARHYQFYPFVNLGHANLGSSGTVFAAKYQAFMRRGLRMIDSRDINDPFQLKIPFVWCSNNYVAAALTQCRLYYEATGDRQYMEMEASLRDWLFGCNPWGTSMICGLPAGGDYPLNPHSAVRVYLGETTFGGLVDGPVYKRIFKTRDFITLLREDPYLPFQNGNVVYHDDIGDYSTNEPTLDGTASLSYYLSTLEKEGRRQQTPVAGNIYDSQGALIRKESCKKDICLIFSADEFGDGFDHIINVLNKNNIKASFFLTGNFLRNKSFSAVVKRLVAGGHYIGPHSDGHLLYMPWENRDSLLLTKDEFITDLKANYAEMIRAGVKIQQPAYFLAPYEWYNSVISSWTSSLGIQLINLTPGTGTNADYTTPRMENYRSSEQLMEKVTLFEKNDPLGLSGAFVLIHPGTDPARTDRLYLRLDELISRFKEQGYTFKKL